MGVRRATRKVRLLALAIAVAIAVPVNAPAWPVPDEPAGAVAVRHDAATPGRPAMNGVAPRAAWHGAGMAYADPSDEPDEGADGLVPGPDRVPAVSVAPFGPVAGPLGLATAVPSRPPLTAAALGRLRC